MTFPLYGYVTDGRLVFDLPGRHAATLRPLEGQRVEVIIRARKSTRSAAQLAWQFGVFLPILANDLGYEKNEIDSLHYAMVQLYGGKKELSLGCDVVTVPLYTASKQMNTKVMSEFMQWESRWAAQFRGLVIPLPDEREWERRLAGAA